jgi:plasmid stabilization system protein ParE
MARQIEFSKRFTNQLQKILTFYDERNGTDAYSRHLLKCLLADINRLSETPTASSPSTRQDVRFFYLMGFTIIFRYNSRRITMLSIRSSCRKPLKLYQRS